MASTLVDVEKVYEQNQDLKKQDVDNLTQWIATQPHLPKVTGKLDRTDTNSGYPSVRLGGKFYIPLISPGYIKCNKLLIFCL